MTAIFIQILGFLAFIFLAVSLWVTNDIKFRWINSMGSISFVLYGICINAFPVILTNAVLLIINIYFLVKIYRKQELFDLVEFSKDTVLIPKFLSFYQKDIEAYFPGFNDQEYVSDIKFVVLRDIVIANIFMANMDSNGNAFVKINYTVPKYRDFKVGRFLFDEGKDYLKEKGIKRIIYLEVSNPNHEKFLKVTGFQKEFFDNRYCYIKHI